MFVATNAGADQVAKAFEQFGSQLTFILSLYGDENTHNHHRGGGSFRRTIAAANLLSEQQGRFAINCVVPNKNYSAIRTLLEMSPRLKPRYIFLTEFIQSVYSLNRDSAQVAHGHEGKEIRALCRHLANKFSARVASSLRINECQADNRPTLAMRIAGIFGIVHVSGYCGAGNWTMHIDQEGNIFPCFAKEYYDEEVSLRRTSIEDAWHQMQEFMDNRRSRYECYFRQVDKGD